ncbi:hypothetical protein [uncultured Erythrobacter sp.]|uniref:hypothetical protein n=1 Tax=uncultured Erythrobacter sp. TaxID=263913 RepID=UPI00262D1B35|nr:hypothetical protein [uncultured Erythrobacter sp.]
MVLAYLLADAVTDLDWIAVYAALLSTFIFVREWRDNRVRLKVTVSHGVDAEKHEGVCAVIRISNLGHRPLVLFGVGLMWNYRRVSLAERIRHMVLYKRFPRRIGWVRGHLPEDHKADDLPRAIDPLNSVDVWVPFDKIDEAIDEGNNVIIAYAQDALGRNSYSQEFTMRGVKLLEAVE